MTKRTLAGLALATTLSVSLTAAAKPQAECDAANQDGGGACFGLEPTFTNQSMEFHELKVGSRPQLDALAKWLELAKLACAAGEYRSCRVEKISALVSPCAAAPGTPNDDVSEGIDQFRVCLYDPDTARKPWYYEVKTDESVLELGTRPANLAWLRALLADGRLAGVWKIAEEAGVKPSSRGTGGGHIHVDAASGFVSVRHLLNFMTRIHSLPLLPLARNIKNVDLLNAAPFSVLGPEIRRLYREALDRHKDDVSRDFVPLMKELRDQVYIYHYASPPGMKRDDKEDPFNRVKYHAVHLHSKFDTVELRGLDAPLTPEDQLDMVELVAAAIASTPFDHLLSLAADKDIALETADEDMLIPAEERFIAKTNGLVDARWLKRMNRPDLLGKDAERIATEFRTFVGDDARLRRLAKYMPTPVRTATEALVGK